MTKMRKNKPISDYMYVRKRIEMMQRSFIEPLIEKTQKLLNESLPHSDDLICSIDFKEDIANGDTFTVQWNTDGTARLICE